MLEGTGYRIQGVGYRMVGSGAGVFGCAKKGDKLGRSFVQRLALCTKSTTKLNYLTSQGLFVRRVCTDARSLDTVCTRRFWRILSAKFSYARFTQPLLMQINKESY